ncbi:hypothetical protein MHBO_003346 [Bonamia ostreae]|uniref:Uncharacterized protein n=1 Tax=Bonamia ostreae TaxID=126728 RepID=A0ABV2AQ70_9EUKA
MSTGKFKFYKQIQKSLETCVLILGCLKFDKNDNRQYVTVDFLLNILQTTDHLLLKSTVFWSLTNFDDFCYNDNDHKFLESIFNSILKDIASPFLRLQNACCNAVIHFAYSKNASKTERLAKIAPNFIPEWLNFVEIRHQNINIKDYYDSLISFIKNTGKSIKNNLDKVVINVLMALLNNIQIDDKSIYLIVDAFVPIAEILETDFLKIGRPFLDKLLAIFSSNLSKYQQNVFIIKKSSRLSKQ